MPISKKALYSEIDISAVEISARRGWEQERRRRESLEKVIVGALPAGVVIMSAIFFFLTAPHTQRIMEMITPWAWVGFISPAAWELGIIVFSALREAGWKNWITFSIIAVLLCMSIFINVSGSYITVIEMSGPIQLDQLTAQQLADKFSQLPIIYQIVLVIAVPVGAVIPILAKLTGETLIKLALGRVKLSTTDSELAWRKEIGEVMYRSLLKAAMRLGANAETAGNWAASVSSQMYGYQNRSETPRLATPQPLPDAPALTNMQSAFLGQGRVKSPELEAWMASNEERISGMSNRDVARLYSREMLGQESDSAYKTVERIRNKGN